MSAPLLNAAVAWVRSAFTPQQVATVAVYGGEFNGAAIGKVSFAAPAIFLTVLGWRPESNPSKLSGRNVRAVRLAAFVVTKHASREQRLAAAMSLSDLLALKLRYDWQPQNGDSDLVAIAPLENEPNCENLFGNAVDEAGLALWLVDWQQEIKPLVPPAVLYDLLSVDIHDDTHQGTVPADTGTSTTPLAVTEEVAFKPLPAPPADP